MHAVLCCAMALASTLLAACGGGGGGASQQPSAPETPAATERINGQQVPPLPDPVLNAATVAGVDINTNGIRDDIDRRIASEFGADAGFLPKAQDHARRLNAAIVTPSPAAQQAYVQTFRCLEDEALLKRLSDQTVATLNTAERRREFTRATSGMVVSTEGC